jgi:hypothetical protein
LTQLSSHLLINRMNILREIKKEKVNMKEVNQKMNNMTVERVILINILKSRIWKMILKRITKIKIQMMKRRRRLRIMTK